MGKDMESETQLEQFTKWKKLVFSNCLAAMKSATGIPYCQLEGVTCCFKLCPRRFYIDAEATKESNNQAESVPPIKEEPHLNLSTNP